MVDTRAEPTAYGWGRGGAGTLTLCFSLTTLRPRRPWRTTSVRTRAEGHRGAPGHRGGRQCQGAPDRVLGTSRGFDAWTATATCTVLRPGGRVCSHRHLLMGLWQAAGMGLVKVVPDVGRDSQRSRRPEI